MNDLRKACEEWLDERSRNETDLDDLVTFVQAQRLEALDRIAQILDESGLDSSRVQLVTSYLPKEIVEIRESAAFQRGRESREAEIAALRFEIRHALEFLEDLKASDNPCSQPDNPQAVVFHMVGDGLSRALMGKAED